MIKKLFSKKTASKSESNLNKQQPESLPADAFQLAIQHHQQGDFVQAEMLYKQILQQQPNNPDVLHYLGLLAYQTGQNQQAVELMTQAISIEPNSSSLYCNLGLALQAQGKLDAAIENYQKAIFLNPDYAEVHNNLGNALYAKGKLEDALEHYRKVILLNPNFVAAHNSVGLVLQAQGKLIEAENSYRNALLLQADYIEARNNLGNVYVAQNKTQAAIECYRYVLKLQPDYVQVHNNLGCLLKKQGKLTEAIECFQSQLALKPDDANGYYNLGVVFFELGELAMAVENYQKVLSLQPSHVKARDLLFHAQLHSCDWSSYINSRDQISKAIKSGEQDYEPFNFLTMSSAIAEQKQCAENFANKYPPSATPLWTGERYQHDKIRLAYLSGDFKEHPVSVLMVGLFEQHDKKRFELIAISLQPEHHSAIGQRVKAAFSQFIDVSCHSDYDVALLMRELEIDIVVDLMGHTKNRRPRILAYRPAPVQVNYLGFPGTMGASYMDYIIADQQIIPVEQQIYYTEKVAYLPDSYLVNDAKRIIAAHTPSRKEVDLPETGFVFCCFNSHYKISPDIFTVWMRLLSKVENSVLWLSEGSALTIQNLRREAMRCGISPERLIFAPRMDLQEDHLARQKLADLFLDTLLYNAHTTASDALWAGLPIVTCMGNAFASRVAGSLLHAVGLPELITHSLEEYEALALKLATTPAMLKQVRDKLIRNRLSYPLFNTDLFRRHIEAAYITMWERYQRGELATSFVVKPQPDLSSD